MNSFIQFALLLGAFLLQSAACNTQSTAPISGTITMSSDWKPVLYLIQSRSLAEIASNYGGQVIDSALIDSDGRFSFGRALPLTEKTLLQLCVQRPGNRFPNQLLDENPLQANYMPVVWQPGTSLEIQAEATRFQATFSFKHPSAENKALIQLRDIRLKAFQSEAPHLGSAAHADETNLLELEDALQRFRQPLMTYADTTPYLLPALLALRWVSPEGDYERVPEFIFRQCGKWQGTAPGHLWAKQLCALANKDKLPVLTGDLIPDYPLPMLSGDTVSLHAQLGKKLTILDVWASWCAPCRHENRDILAPLWAKYETQGLQILGYSIDSSPQAWTAAIAKDGAAWSHASHLSGDATPFLETLRISTIPANFILDGQGKVLAKNLHGEALKTFVANHFK